MVGEARDGERRAWRVANHGGGAVWHQRRVLTCDVGIHGWNAWRHCPSGTFVCIEVMADPAQPPSAVRRPSAGRPQPIR